MRELIKTCVVFFLHVLPLILVLFHVAVVDVVAAMLLSVAIKRNNLCNADSDDDNDEKLMKTFIV